MTPLTRTLLVFALILTAWITGFLMGGTFRAGTDLVSAAGGKAGAAGAAASADAAKDSAAAKRESMIDAAEKRRMPWDKERLTRTSTALLRESGIANFFRHSTQFMDQLSAADFPLALEVNDAPDKHGEFAEMLSAIAVIRWTELDPKAAADYLVKHEKLGGFIDIAGTALWNTWGANDPDAALAYAKSMPEQNERERSVKKIIETIAQTDPEKALALSKIHAPEMLKSGDIAAALSGNTRTANPEAAARSLVSMESSDTTIQSALRDTLNVWARTDHGAALAFARGLSTPATRDAAITGAYTAWIDTAPKEAAESFLTESHGSADFQGVLRMMAERWPLEDWKEANAWSTKLTSEKERTAFSVEFAARMARNEPDDTVKWIESLPDGAQRDAVIAAATTSYMGFGSQQTLNLALTIADPGTRQKTTQKAIQNWFLNDPAAAYDWLQNDPTLTPEQKRGLLAK